ncbi:MAG TPA: ATPase domain-containing protein [Gemmatimonadales bacterium]|nr:ATPase domain-containing protein [Gemmatimonadales bacterium]
MSAGSRVGTGNREADLILDGGFPVNSLNILMGEPGTGKTLFAEQLLFSNAGDDRPVLYLTTLSEPLSKMVTYLQRFGFYDENKLGTSVIYDDLGASLTHDGLSVLLARLRQAIETIGPKIIVIDSFKAIHDLSSSTVEMRRLVSDLAGLLGAYATTTFLVGEYQAQDVARYPEFAVADGILEFARQKRSTTDERFLRVIKLRGSGYMEGLHGLHITSQGLEVYPRLVSPDAPTEYRLKPERIKTGIGGLDSMLEGGVWRGSTTLLMGPTGSGKTMMALQFALTGAAAGEPGLYVNFQENPTQLLRIIKGLDPAGLGEPQLHLLYTSAVELQIDKIIVDIFRRIEAHRIRRVVIDAVGDLAMAAGDTQRIHDYLYALIQRFATLGITTFLIVEDLFHGPSGAPFPAGEFTRLSYMCDNLILLEILRDQRIRRSISIHKTRASGHADEVRSLILSERGARVE